MPRHVREAATKIVATIADNAEKPGALEALLVAGADVVRLNGAHAKRGDIGRRTALVRRVAARLGRPVGVLLDLGGPKIRLGGLPGGSVSLVNGRTVEIAAGVEPMRGRPGVLRLTVTYPGLLKDVRPGAEIRIDDGLVRLEVVRRLRGALRAVVRTGGRVKSEAGVNFPTSTLTAPALTAKDRRDLAEALDAGVDFVGLSFVRSASHVAQLRRLLERVPAERRPWVVAKIERPEALLDLDRIAAASDALMVARGDLGVEIGLPRVPAAQREILAAGRRHAVPVIVATQMLESMIEHPVPTRAEVSDVALAVHDGADAVMLSGETAIGAFPVEAVRTMGEIASAAEAPDGGGVAAELPAPPPDDFTAVVARAAAEAARLGRASALVVHTESGRTARLASKSALSLPIVAFTPRESVRRKLTLLRDVVSFRVPKTRTVEERIRAADELLAKVPRLRGATIVEVSGASPAAGATNVVRLRRLP
jgi:pyruvate kinase